MEGPATARKKRKCYPHESQPFDVPLSTRHYRQRQLHGNEAEEGNDEPPVLPGTWGASAASAAFTANSADDTTVDPSAEGIQNTLPCTGDNDDPCGSDSSPTLHQALSAALNEYGTAALPGSATTKAAAIAMILAFVIAHGLPWDTVDGLLRLIDALFGFRGNVLPRSKYLLRKLWTAQLDSHVRHHYYCEVCGSVLDPANGVDQVQCSLCSESFRVLALKENGSFFSIMNLKEQLVQLISTCSTALYSQMRKIDQTLQRTEITDITSGSLYRNLRHTGRINSKDLTITINTDGSPVYKSSKTSVWPIQFVVNELPPKLRQQHPILGGLWFGQAHPNMTAFMEKFVEELKTVGTVVWTHGSETVTSRVYAICCTVDAPARAAVGNHIQFNGRFGCPWCLTSGMQVEGARRYLETVGVARTSAGMLRDMKLALDLDVPVNGLKGPSPLMNLENFDLVSSQAVDYMHCVLLGVARQLTEFWLDSSNSHEPFYIGTPSIVAILDRRLLSICPPHCFTRLPRTLNDRCFWKASEWKNWLLFYCLPTVFGVLRPRFWKHTVLLVEGVFALLLSNISPRDLQLAASRLHEFVSKAAGHYGPRFMTFNVHQLLHLANSVESLGPLWANSAFPFETGNGKVVRMVKAAKGAPMQILERILVEQKLEVALQSLSLPNEVKSFCARVLGNGGTKKAVHISNVCLFGAPLKPYLTPQEEQAVNDFVNKQSSSVNEFFRMSFQGTVIHSQQYKKAKKSNSCVVMTHDNNFYSVRRILQVLEPGSDLSGTVVLLCQKLVLSSAHGLPSHIRECLRSPFTTCAVLTPSDLSMPCLFIDFAAEATSYVCTLPNLIERD